MLNCKSLAFRLLMTSVCPELFLLVGDFSSSSFSSSVISNDASNTDFKVGLFISYKNLNAICKDSKAIDLLNSKVKT